MSIPKTLHDGIVRDAVLSSCNAYRYSLTRAWEGGGKRYVLWIGLNPSTADAHRDDPTIRRCMAFTKAFGYRSMRMANLFAFRATEPDDMLVAVDPVGPDNDAHLQQLYGSASLVIAAWGTDGGHRGRDRHVRDQLPQMHVLRLTKDGHPAHPLYLPGTLRPTPWSAA